MIFVYLLAARRSHVTRGSSGAALRQKVGAGAQVTRGSPRAAPSRGGTWRPWSCPEPGAGARAMGTHGGLGATLSLEVGVVVLT
jgi:hypothetical protein